MKSYLIILLAFCLSGCYSHVQYLSNSYSSSSPSESYHITSTDLGGGEYQNWQFLGIDYYPYYKNYKTEWNSLPELNLAYSSRRYTDAGFSPDLAADEQPAYNGIFSNPILVCWNPPVYPASGYAPGTIPINIGVGIINDSRIKKSGTPNHGPRSIGPNRVRDSQVIPDRTRSTSITRGQQSITGRSSGSSARYRTRGN